MFIVDIYSSDATTHSQVAATPRGPMYWYFDISQRQWKYSVRSRNEPASSQILTTESPRIRLLLTTLRFCNCYTYLLRVHGEQRNARRKFPPLIWTLTFDVRCGEDGRRTTSRPNVREIIQYNTNKNLYSAKFVDKTRQRRWWTHSLYRLSMYPTRSLLQTGFSPLASRPVCSRCRFHWQPNNTHRHHRTSTQHSVVR